MATENEDQSYPELDEIFRRAAPYLRGHDGPNEVDAKARQIYKKAMRYKRYRRICTGLAACVLLGILGAWFFLHSDSLDASTPTVHVNAKQTTRRDLGDPHKARIRNTWKLSVNFPGTGYIYICSQHANSAVVVDPRDSVQKKPLTSNGSDVELLTPFDSDNELRLFICVTDRPAGTVIESAIHASGISLFEADPHTLAALRRIIKNAVREHGIRVVAFSDDVRVLNDNR